MENYEKSTENKINKKNSTILPLGFGVSEVDKSFVIIEFLDVIDGQHTVVASVALSKQRAATLAETIVEAISSSEDDSEQ